MDKKENNVIIYAGSWEPDIGLTWVNFSYYIKTHASIKIAVSRFVNLKETDKSLVLE